jgi:hypothetical protein
MFGYRSNSVLVMMMEMWKLSGVIQEVSSWDDVSAFTLLLHWSCNGYWKDVEITGVPGAGTNGSSERMGFLHSRDIRLYSTARRPLMFQKLITRNTLNHLMILELQGILWRSYSYVRVKNSLRHVLQCTVSSSAGEYESTLWVWQAHLRKEKTLTTASHSPPTRLSGDFLNLISNSQVKRHLSMTL